MKGYIIPIFFAFLLAANGSYSQETGSGVDSVLIKEREAKERKQIEKKIEKAEKRAKKAEKEAKKIEKEEKKRKKLEASIRSKQKSIDRDEKKMIRLEEKLLRDDAKGKLSPVDKAKLNSRIQKLKTGMVKDKEKLKKLRRKQ